MCPHIIGNIDRPIKNVLKNVGKYEFNLHLEKISLIEEETKDISFTGLIWKELGKEAFIEWRKFYKDKANTVNLLHLAISLFGKLLTYGYKYVQEAEVRYEKNHPKVEHLRPVILLSDQPEIDFVSKVTNTRSRLRDNRICTRQRTQVLVSLRLEIK